jgi:hypothetical protein
MPSLRFSARLCSGEMHSHDDHVCTVEVLLLRHPLCLKSTEARSSTGYDTSTDDDERRNTPGSVGTYQPAITVGALETPPPWLDLA